MQRMRSWMASHERKPVVSGIRVFVLFPCPLAVDRCCSTRLCTETTPVLGIVVVWCLSQLLHLNRRAERSHEKHHQYACCRSCVVTDQLHLSSLNERSTQEQAWALLLSLHEVTTCRSSPRTTYQSVVGLGAQMLRCRLMLISMPTL